MKRSILAVLLLFSTSAASADGMNRQPSPPRERYEPCCELKTYHWGGLFIGGHLAGAISQADFSNPGNTDGFEHDERSFGGGAVAALHYQREKLVLGIETSFTWIDFEGRSSSLLAPATAFSSNISDLITVVGKIGFADERWLAYLKAGYASADFTVRSTTAGVTTSSSDREHGWMMGIGFDYALTDRLILGVAYDWSFFDVDSRSVGTQLSGNDDIQMISARLLYKFGRD